MKVNVFIQELIQLFQMDKGAIQGNAPKRHHEKMKTDSTTCQRYIEKIKIFLSQFKTKPCQNQNQHDCGLCQFHHEIDKRRNPYLGDSFLYYPEYDLPQHHPPNETCLNQSQFLYHPIVYKTQQCSNYYKCPHQLYCPHLHSYEKKLFEYGQFFRFDINTHKTKICGKRDHHERKTCIFYHNDLDKRRSNFKDYSHQLCSNKKCQQVKCPYSHNKIEQVYHPSRYKSKFCQIYHNKSAKCQYKEFCAFAHNQAQIKVQIIHLETRDHDFFLYKYKTVWCPNTQQHDRGTCVYAHNIQDFRRNPLQFKYKSEKCQHWNFEDELKSIEESGCKAGMKCDKCHGWMEQRYHPQIYKKGKQASNDPQMMQMIQKKLKNKDTSKLSHRISAVIEEKKKIEVNKSHMHSVGLPFFKKEHDMSQSSRKTKAITTNIESDDSYARQQQSKRQKQKEINIRKNNMFLFAEDNIWRSQEDENNEFQRKLNEERARSQSKFDDCQTVYSHSLKQTVGNSDILRKLKNNNINGVKIKNLSQEEISDFGFLNKNQKQILSHKVRLYHLKRQRNPILYSIQLSKFFIRRKKQSILEKTQSMKIKEEQLLTMKLKQIENCQFFTPEEKSQLPALIQQYKKFQNQSEFNQINEQISRFVSPKPQRPKS